MEMLKNFSETFLSVWNKGILGVDIFQILIGIGIFLIFLVFRGLISKLIIKKLEVISKRTTNKLDDTFVSSLIGPARFIPIVLGFFIASYYMTFSTEGREIVDTINRTLITILIPHNSKTAASPNININIFKDFIIHPINSRVNNLSNPLKI